MRLFKSLLAKAPQFTAPIQPDAPFFAVGDIHGSLDLLKRVPEIADQEDRAAHPIVFVGDYIDRGPDSAGVLRWLQQRQIDMPDQTVCLMGNHERMMLDTLENPEKHGPRWLRHGGMETVASFGVQPVIGQGDPEKWASMKDQLLQAMGEPLLTWIKGLDLSWQSGNVFVCHAGAHPAQPVAFQNAKTLLWGCEEFQNRTRDDGTWILHGHTIVDEPSAINGRIAIDTGAYATGNLTCAYVTHANAKFLNVTNW